MIHPLTILAWLFGGFCVFVAFLSLMEENPNGFVMATVGITFFCGVLTILVERLRK